MKVLGYNGALEGYPANFGAGHDSAAALVVDGEVVAAVEEERFSREKHSGKFPSQAMAYCLKEGGLRSVADVDLVTYYWSFPLMFQPGMVGQNKHGLNLLERVGTWSVVSTMRAYNRVVGYDDERSRRTLERATGVKLRDGQFKAVPHHLGHAASAFHDSPFEKALIVTLDAAGESASSLVATGEGSTITPLHEVLVPNSLGYLYLFLTDYLGFRGMSDEYKVMGLAPYGNPATYRDYFQSVVRLRDNGTYEVDPGLMVQFMVTLNGHGSVVRPPSLLEALGPARKPGETLTQRHMDVAAALQETLERAVLHALGKLQEQTGMRHLCMAGGVALNSSMNGKIAHRGLFEEVWVHPAAHDAGCAVGSALVGYHHVLQQPRVVRRRSHAFLGPAWPYGDVTAALREFSASVTHERPADLLERVAREVADGKVVGFYQGRMEWGPRALGNRSILADPRRDDMKDIVNHAVKMREGFRPFAPVVMAERAASWFDMTGLPESPFMLFVVPVWEGRRSAIPAVTHVDGSARIQTVTAEQNPRYHGVIAAFERLTGVPVLLNTSFNVKGEPIVNTPADAIRCFLGTQIDLLVLEDVLVHKRPEAVEAIRRERAAGGWKTGRVVDGRIESV
jgi:carbamoyltransferase